MGLKGQQGTWRRGSRRNEEPALLCSGILNGKSQKNPMQGMLGWMSIVSIGRGSRGIQGGRDERIVCVLYTPSLGCISNLSSVTSGETLGAQEGRECVSERLTKHFLLFYGKKNDLGLTFQFRLPGNWTEVSAGCVARQHGSCSGKAGRDWRAACGPADHGRTAAPGAKPSLWAPAWRAVTAPSRPGTRQLWL